METAFIYTDAYSDYDYGPSHPFQISRLKLTYELIKAYGLFDLPSARLIPTIKAEDEDLALFHSPDYLDMLRQSGEETSQGNAHAFGLGPGDNPIFPGLYDWCRLVGGATLQAVDWVTKGEGRIAFSIAGGLHHAMKSKAAGFCYINDPVIGIMKLMGQNKRVAYIDLDAHHGDGVQNAFYNTDRVLTISFHESGRTLFPGTGFENEIGEGEGEGYCVNLPLPIHTDDEIYLWAFDEIVPELIRAFQPDVIVTQLGVDTFFNDPLTNLNLTLSGFEKAVGRIKQIAPRWVALGGGGYDTSNVARAWTLVWAVMNGVKLEEEIPESFTRTAASGGIHCKELRGSSRPPLGNHRHEISSDVEKAVRIIKTTVFPKIVKAK